MTSAGNIAAPGSPSRWVIGLISDQVRRNPDATAVVCADRRLTYQQLDALSSQVARYIHLHGARGQTPVAVCMPRGVDAIVITLAILKAGAIYVPLDPGHPPQRLVSAIANARASVLLTDRPEVWLERVPDVMVVAATPLPGSDQSSDLPLPVISDTDLAYVIHTSGSTGAPKGVMVEHAALSCHIEAMCRLYELGPGDRVLLLSSLAFDASLEAIFSALAAGAQLVVAQDLLGTAELIDMIWQHGVTVVELTPLYWAQVVDVLPSRKANALESLRMLILGGDVVPAGTLEKFISMHPCVAVLNTYGPAEATIACTAFRVPPGWSGTIVPIGRPSVPEKRVYILDEQLNAVPHGNAGEICVAGPVARGYLHDPVLTAQRFVIWQPSTGYSPERIYRTGDRGRVLADGTIEFLGRMDRQVKVRGMRTEPAEVEGTLSRHPAVLAAVVVPVGDVTDRRLTAYIEWATGARESISDLRSFAREHLPSPMVPTSWVSVDLIPTTVAGKVDLAVLQRAEPTGPADNQAASEETVLSETEEIIADIWRDVLSVPEVTPQDNFFDLGGHSLSAMQLVFRLTDCFSVEIPLTAAFTYPTLHDMAEFVEQRLWEEDESMSDEEVAARLKGTDH